MSLALRIDISGIDSVRRAMGRIADAVESERVVRKVGAECAELLAKHFHDINGQDSHHRTINRLGARSSHHFDRAAGQVSYEMSGGGGVNIVVTNTPGLQRAFHDMDIYARGKLLTIPTDAEAYSKRAAELRNSFGWLLFRPKRKTGELLPYLFGTKKAVKGRGRKAKTVRETRLMYVLRKHVHIKQDRTLLPSDEQIAKAASRAVEMQLEADGVL